ncbi:MAG: DNA-directed DNA polymerase [Candidatus Micrarchaeota archaeon]
MVIRKAYFLDADYVFKNDLTYVRLQLKGKKTTFLYYQTDPYFYVDASTDKIDDLKKITAQNKDGSICSILRVESVKKNVFGTEKSLLKVFCKQPRDVPSLKHSIPFTCYEYNILFGKRFMLDMQLSPFSVITYEREGNKIKKIIKIETGKPPDLKSLAFDIETYNPVGMSREKTDPVIMISYSNSKSEVLTSKKSKHDFVRSFTSEKEILEGFCKIVQQENPDVIFGYNSSQFDLPYLQARSDILNTKLDLGKEGKRIKQIRKGMVNGMQIFGRTHVDLYPLVRFFSFIGLIKTEDFTLDKVAKSLNGMQKIDIDKKLIYQMWDQDQVDTLADYALMDAKVTEQIGQRYLNLLIELANITKFPLFDLALSTSGQMVESVLMFNANTRNEIIPSKPSEAAIKERTLNPIQGAFVKLPEPGIYDNIAVMDFRGLYPSIIASYNIDPYTITKTGDEKTCHYAPNGAVFLKQPMGLIPSVVNWLLDYRTKIKKELKNHDKNSETYKQLDARSWSLKIVTNSIYGYLAYPRSRWYSRESGDATTAYGRKHITETIAEAEKWGFHVLYGDTDSIFFLYKEKQKVLEFVEHINKNLPEKMELELEGFYPRGVFVSKKTGSQEKGAKKKYALLGDDGRIKIRGFELVRRDWSDIAKKTQYDVLEAILREGSKEKAVAIARKTIERLKKGEVSLTELAIETKISKDMDKYAIKSPEVAAAEKAQQRGVKFEKDNIISYVITKKGKSISEKAELLEFAKDYDPDYYINNQVLPAVMKILKELGYDEHALKMGGVQKGLGSFFE